MRQLLLHYYNSVRSRKHICLTIITLFFLFFVGTHSPCNGAATDDSKTLTNNWQQLLDGKSLKGWAITDFAGHGEVKTEGDSIILGEGVMTGITWTNDLPKMNYEISLEAMRVEGSDFFCALTFPVNEDPCSLIVGGWGGGVVGLSSLDGQDAANNDTTKYMSFENGRSEERRVGKD